MNPVDVVALVAGLLMCASRFVWLIPGKINIPAFSAQIVKLVRANNVDRAKKLCNAAPTTFFSKMIRPVLDAVSEADPSEHATIVREELNAAFSRARTEQLARARTLWWLPPIGVGVACIGVAGAYSHGSPPIQVAASPVVDTLIALSAWRAVRLLERQSARSGAEIIDAAITTRDA